MRSSKRFYLLLTAAGSSSRFEGGKKELQSLDGMCVLSHSLNTFSAFEGLLGIVITYPAGGLEDMKSALFLDEKQGSLTTKVETITFVEGGSTRQASVLAGLNGIKSRLESKGFEADASIVLIHDGARPWVGSDIISRVLDSCFEHGACIPLCDFTDTPKIVDTVGFITEHPERAVVKAAQTPQGFSIGPLLKAHRKANDEGCLYTDDSSIWQQFVGPVAYVEGDRKNRKITYREDVESGALSLIPFPCRVGEGWDIHPLVEGRRLLLGGVAIDFDRGEYGHSDGDVLWHAIIDALLGAAGMGDIGVFFPPEEETWKDANSSHLARIVSDALRERGFTLVHIDCTVLIERPRLGPYKEAIRSSVAIVLGVPKDSVSVKAKTYEGFGPVGEGLAVEARALALITSSPSV
jgi:2-C-methyl-D-erythritol 4-phosphate cytidylyltransferase/2-C-methyl-D-erythritol 2,4-cyclodiphosphate synthase